jgi:CHAD domain-containing protein
MPCSDNRISELCELGSIFDAWAENAKTHIPVRSKTILVIYKLCERALVGTKNTYGALDESAYRKLKQSSETKDEKAVQVLLKALKERNRNTLIIMCSTGPAKLRQYLPKMDDPNRIRDLAKKHGYSGLLHLIR